MFKRRAYRRARRIYELRHLESEMEANRRRLRELDEQWSRPCPVCVERGWV